MSDKVQCSTHGESEPAFVCTHLVGDVVGLGFNRNEPTDKNPFPDAWCDDCEIVRAASDGWNERSEQLLKISLLCSGCYERACIRNTHTAVTLKDLESLRWKCGSCEEWHTGPCLDFGYDAPFSRRDVHAPLDSENGDSGQNWPSTFLDNDYCVVNDEDFFVRGLICLPVIGSRETLRWGVWGSLSRDNFEKLWRMKDDSKRVELPAMFSWLNTRIPDYPDTLALKMYACIQEPGCRPYFELEPTDHPLSREFHHGITAERVKEIMFRRLQGNE